MWCKIYTYTRTHTYVRTHARTRTHARAHTLLLLVRIYLDNKYDPPLLVGPLCLHTATRVYQCETVFAVLNQVHAEGYTHTLRCAGVYTIMADFFPSKRRASDPYMVTVRRLAYALQRVTHPTCSPVATRSPSVLFSCFCKLLLRTTMRTNIVLLLLLVYLEFICRINHFSNTRNIIDDRKSMIKISVIKYAINRYCS